MNPVRSNLSITPITKAMQNSTIMKKGLNDNIAVACGDLLLTG